MMMNSEAANVSMSDDVSNVTDQNSVDKLLAL